jgi:hypothetical protein
VEGKGVHDEEEKWREKESMMKKRSGGKGVYDEEEKWRVKESMMRKRSGGKRSL